jgi:hypothetical protein
MPKRVSCPGFRMSVSVWLTVWLAVSASVLKIPSPNSRVDHAISSTMALESENLSTGAPTRWSIER